MKSVGTKLGLAILFLSLFGLAYYSTGVLTFPIGFIYRNTPGLSNARAVTQYAALAAAVSIFIASVLIAFFYALTPATRFQKFLFVLPLFTLGLTLAGALMNGLGIGAVFSAQGVGRFNFATV